MKRLLAVAAFLLASSAAQAQYSFQYGGHTIRIDPDRGTVSIPGVYDNTGRKSKRAHADQDSTHKQQQPPQEAKVDPQAQRVSPARLEDSAEFRNFKIDSCWEPGAIEGLHSCPREYRRLFGLV